MIKQQPVYDPEGLKILESMPPVRKRGFTIVFDDELPDLDRRALLCSELLAADVGLSSISVVDLGGRKMEIRRG